jgi:hypothetical protein
VRGASGRRLLTDLVSLVRFALHQDDELVPHAARVKERFQNWMSQQANAGRKFSPEQAAWLQMIRDHVAASWEIEIDDFDNVPFIQEGGLGKAMQVFGRSSSTAGSPPSHHGQTWGGWQGRDGMDAPRVRLPPVFSQVGRRHPPR